MLEEFTNHPHFHELEHRAAGFAYCISHLAAIEGEAFIIETGTARIKDNWSGDGQSTLIWDWVLERKPNLRAISIDLDPNAVSMARLQCEHVGIICNDSIKELSRAADWVLEKTRLLYLDSFDWSPELNLDSAFHHMAELATVWAKLPSGCLIVVDDCHAPMQGKHFMVEFFMQKLGIAPAFRGYQTGWVKP